MQLRMWTYDIAREQSPTLDYLRRLMDVTIDAGFNAIGFYLEHRFAYPSTPWAHGKGCVTPEMIQALQKEYPGTAIVPCINLLGHFEGMLYTEYGSRFAEERFRGMQADPTNDEFVRLAERIIDDTVDIFNSEIIHIGGDETWQLGAGERSKSRVAAFEAAQPGLDGKAVLYAQHFAPLAQRVIDRGRTPAVWGDMFFDHPQALDRMPKSTIIFDWQYFRSPEHTSRRFFDSGHRVVFCPAIHTYNAAWCHLPQSERNVREHAQSATQLGAFGVCVTTWECGLFGNYETLVPIVRGCGQILRDEEVAAQSGNVGLLNSKLTEAELRFDARGELAAEDLSMEGPYDRLIRTIVAEMLDGAVRRFEIGPYGDELAIRTLEPVHAIKGVLPANLDLVLTNRVRLLSGLPAMGRLRRQEGVLSGLAAGERFALRVLSEPMGNRVRLEFMNNAPLKAAGSPFPLPGQGGPDAIAKYAEEATAEVFLKQFLKLGETHEEWARLMGLELQTVGGLFAFSGVRSAIKCRLLLYSNPFLLWLHHREELAGETGRRALEIAHRALAMAPDANTRGVAQFLIKSIEFVQLAEEAHLAYAEKRPGAAITALAPCRQIFEDLGSVAKATSLNACGSLADIERCRLAREHVERVILRVKQYGDGSLGYLPSFEYLTHPKFVPHDQSAWWLINRWANE